MGSNVIIVGGGDANSAKEAVSIIKKEAKIINFSPEPLKIKKQDEVLTPLEAHYHKKVNDRVERIKLKSNADIEYYNDKLDNLIAESLKSICPHHTADDIKKILLDGDKKWRSICANAKLLKKYILLDVDAFEKQLNTVVYKSNEIQEVQEKFISNVEQANRNVFTRMWYKIKVFINSFLIKYKNDTIN